MSDGDASATTTDEFVGRIFEATVGTMDLYHVYLGDRLGLYQALADDGPLDPAGLAAAADIDERYAREWLQHQAVARILAVEADGRFSLPPAQAEVLLDPTSLNYFGPAAAGVVGIAGALPEVLAAFRTGAGVPYESYGADLRDAIAGLNRPMFRNLLGRKWFPAIPDVHERLQREPSATVADVGCGSGWSSIAIAQAYPDANIVGLDLDEASIDQARANADAEGVADRVRFEQRDAVHPELADSFDLVCAFETIHDMCDPVGALRAMRAMRADGGTVIVADERVADVFTVDVDDTERFQWGFSALHCLPCARTDPPAAGTGTIMRTSQFREYATEAGYSDVEVLPIENDFWRFYRLVD